jgi:SAM-dependent methyltransferase
MVAAVTGSQEDFPGRIHPADEMLLYNLDLLHGNPTCAAILYFVKGFQAAAAVLELARWRFRGRELGPVLDFASGYGRVTRFLIRDLPPEQLWVTDAVDDAVRFQRAAFGVHGFVSPPALEDLVADRRFPLVVACSLFSHLPRRTFGPWLRRLWDLVDDHGLLAVSVLDASLLGAAGAPDGFAYFPESESRVLEGDRYGTTYVAEETFRAILRDEGLDGCRSPPSIPPGGRCSVARIPAGLCAHQDLYLIAKGDDADFASLDLTRYPQGELDVFEIRGEEVELGGWVRDVDPDGGVREMCVHVNDRVVSTFAPSSGDASRGRWTTRIRLDEVALDDVVVIAAVNGRGAVNVVAIGTLRPYVTGRPAPDFVVESPEL